MRDMRVYVQDMMECIEVKDLGRYIIGLKRYAPCALPALRKATAGGRSAFR